MPRRESAPIRRAHVWLFEDDLNFVRDTYGDTIGVAKAIRTIVHGFHKRVKEKAAETEALPQFNFSLEELAKQDDGE